MKVVPFRKVDAEKFVAQVQAALKDDGAVSKGIFIIDSPKNGMLFITLGESQSVELVGLLEWVKLRIYTDSKGLTTLDGGAG